MKRVPSGLCFIYHSLWQGDGFRRASAHFLALRGHPRKLDRSLVLAALSRSWGRNYLACVDLNTASTFTEVAKPAQENFSSVGEIPFQGSMTQLLTLTFPDLSGHSSLPILRVDIHCSKAHCSFFLLHILFLTSPQPHF